MPVPKQLGRYQIEAHLGSGGTADVYRARDVTLNRVVALKVLKPQLTIDPKAFERFMREAQAAANLFHPHIAWVYDIGQEQGFSYLATRYVDGPSLAAVLQSRGRLPWSEALAILQQVAEALDFAHQQNFIHRDVKPHNILIGAKAGAVLTDFGLVRAVQSTGQTTQTGLVTGTLHYIAPEMLRNQPTPPAADQYALACVVAEMLSGKRLYDAAETPALIYKHLAPPEFPKPWPQGVPAGVEAALARALAIQPAQRYPSVGAFAAALAECGRVQPKAAPVPAELPDWLREMAAEEAQPTRASTKPVVSRARDNTSSILLQTLPGHKSWVSSIAFSPNGQYLASGSWDATVRLWDTTTRITGQRVEYLKRLLQGHTSLVTSVVFSPNGKALASGSGDNTVRLWDVDSGATYSTLEGHTSMVTKVVFSPNGRTLASGSGDNTVRLWDLENAKLLYTLEGHTHLVSSLAFSLDGRILASGSDDATVRLWNVAGGKLLYTLPGDTAEVTGLAFSPNGRILASASADAGVRLWDVADGKLLHTLQGHTAGVWSVVFFPDGSTLASAAGDNTVRLWDAASGQSLRTLEGHQSLLKNTAFSPDGQYLASGSDDGAIRMWGFRSQEQKPEKK